MLGFVTSAANLPPLAYIIEHKPIDLSLSINPQELLLSDGQYVQELAIPGPEESQHCDMIRSVYEFNYGSDACPSCPAVEETFWPANQESADLTEACSLYNSIYAITTEAIRVSDTSPPSPPLLKNESLLTVFDNLPPPICYTTDMDYSNEVVYDADMEPMGTWVRTLSAEEVPTEEEIALVLPKVKSKPKEENKIKKRTRPNFHKDTISILMDWYLANNGTVPSNSQKKILASRTNKTEAQITTWFHNAKKGISINCKVTKSCLMNILTQFMITVLGNPS